MKKIIIAISLLLFIFLLLGCTEQPPTKTSYNEVKAIEYDGVKINVYLDIPTTNSLDYVLLVHGTLDSDKENVQAAKILADKIKPIIHKEVGLVSVAYPQENLLMGDNIIYPEAALLWLKNNAEKELGVKINKIYLIGHSQGGYLVTRLNTMYETDGVIANGPGPIDLAVRCQGAEDSPNAPPSMECNLIKDKYGSAYDNPTAYSDRSMINFAFGQKSKILFIQGMDDTLLQTTGLEKFEEKINTCTNCAPYRFLRIKGVGHGAIVESKEAEGAVNNFIN